MHDLLFTWVVIVRGSTDLLFTAYPIVSFSAIKFTICYIPSTYVRVFDVFHGGPQFDNAIQTRGRFSCFIATVYCLSCWLVCLLLNLLPAAYIWPCIWCLAGWPAISHRCTSKRWVSFLYSYGWLPILLNRVSSIRLTNFRLRMSLYLMACRPAFSFTPLSKQEVGFLFNVPCWGLPFAGSSML